MAQQNIVGQQAQVNTLFADNSNEDITPLDLRTISLNVTDSVPFLNDVASISGVWTHTAIVKGVTPVAGEDLATKAYVDANAGVAAGDVVGQSSSFDTEIVVFSGTNGKLINGGTGVKVAANGDFTGLGNLGFATATKLIGTVAVGNLADISTAVNITGAWSFDDITVPAPTTDLHAATKKYVDDNIGSGDVGVSGTPVDNQIAVWTGASTIEGDANLTWNAATNTLAVGGTLSLNDLTIDNIIINGNDISTTSGDLTLTPFTGNVTVTSVNDVPLIATGSATNYLTEAGTYATIAGGGDVLSTGTPLDNQIAVWTNATTIEGTTGLTYDGTTFNAGVDAVTLGSTNVVTLDTSNSGYSRIYGDTRLILDGDYSGSTEGITSTTLSAYWDGYKISEIQMQTGDDTVNKDNGVIQFRTAPNSSSIQIAGQIESDQTWNFYGNTLTSIDDILRGADNTRLNISGGSTSTLGANMSLTGNTDGSNVDSVIFRIDSADTLVIDENGDVSISNDLAITGDITGDNTFGGEIVLGSGTFGSTRGKLYTDATNGLIFAGITGSTNDFLLVNNGGQTIMASPTGGNTVGFGSLSTGIVYANGGILTMTNPSDERLKTIHRKLPYGLKEILLLAPVMFNYEWDGENQSERFGYSANKVQEILPEIVCEFDHKTKDGDTEIRLGFSDQMPNTILVNAIQELAKRLEKLENA